MKTTGALEKSCRAKNNHFSGTCYKKQESNMNGFNYNALL